MTDTPENLLSELTAIESASWEAIIAGQGGAFFDDALTSDALVVIPGMVVDRANIVASFSGEPEWASFSIDDAHLVPLSDDAAVLTYRATAKRLGSDDDEQFLIGTAYRSIDGVWRIATQHHVPGTSGT